MVRSGQEVTAAFTDISDRPAMADAMPISHMLVQMYTQGGVDQVVLAYSRFVNMLVQQPTLVPVLPVEPQEVASPGAAAGYLYEPAAPLVFDALLPRFLEMQVYHAVLENNASEQSARMVAMQNATEAAGDMVDALTLEMNKERQESITNELLDIVGGVAALRG